MRNKCTKCRMIRIIVFKQEFPNMPETYKVKLCAKCCAESINILLDHMTPTELKNQLVYLSGGGNRG